jgi:predicted MPP superfamily phosphohydrolase
MNFFTILIFCFLVGDVVWIVRVCPLLRSWIWRVAVVTFGAVQLCALLAVILDRFEGPHLSWLLARPILSAVFIWHLLLLPAIAVIWISFSLGALPVRIARRTMGRRPAQVPVDAGLTRREFLAASMAAAPAIVTLGATAASQPQLEQFRVRRLTVPLPQLPPALDGLTIAQVSDLHVGRFTRGAVLNEVVKATNGLDADLVLLTGDLINYDLKDLPAGLDLVKAMRGHHGVFMCEGNHDLFESPLAFRLQTRDAGVPLLVNESVPLEIRGVPVQLLGLAWSHDDASLANDLRKLLAQRTANAFPILLAHHPHAFDHAEDLPLTLSGHTHGGQLMLTDHTGFGPAMFRYWSGLYRKEKRALVVSNGVGNWFPLRLRAPAEIIHLTLRRA